MNLLGQRVSLPRLAIGVALGVGALWLALRGLNQNDLVAVLRDLDYRFTAAALGSTILTLIVGTLRWQLLFYPAHRSLAFGHLFRAAVIGQMVNILSPVRVGELARLYALADRERVSKAQVLATLALEKVLDLFLFGVAVAVLLTLMAIPGDIRVKNSAQLGVGIAAMVGLWLTAHFAIPLARRLEPILPRLPPRWRNAGKATLVRFVDGLSTLRRLHTGAALFGLSLALLVCSALTNHLLFLAFGLDVPIWAALFLLVLLQVGAVPPSLPGRIGIFHYLTVVGLGVFGVDRVQALSYSIVLYAVALLPKVVIGAAYFISAPVRTETPRPQDS